MIDKIHLLVLALRVAAVGDIDTRLPPPVGGDSSVRVSQCLSMTPWRDREQDGLELGVHAQACRGCA
jgi:hypothetical protein